MNNAADRRGKGWLYRRYYRGSGVPDLFSKTRPCRVGRRPWLLAPYEGYMAKGVQVLFVVALIGQIVAYRQYQNRWLLSLSALATVLLLSGYYIVPSSLLLQLSLLGLANLKHLVGGRTASLCKMRSSTYIGRLQTLDLPVAELMVLGRLP